MTKITTKALINFLPFSTDFKLDLLESYDSLPQEERSRISELIWNFYFDFYDLKIKENFDKGIKEYQLNSKLPDKNYFGEVVQKTNKEFQKALGSSNETVNLSEVRKSMQQIINEINASKKQPKIQKPS